MQGLFEALRKAILALDPCVNEEFLKLYVAYKAETNFVDVVPQAKRLLLVLNLSISRNSRELRRIRESRRRSRKPTRLDYEVFD